MDQFVKSLHCGDMFILTDTAFVYFLPIHIGLCLMDNGGRYLEILEEEFEKRMASVRLLVSLTHEPYLLKIAARVSGIIRSPAALDVVTYPTLCTTKFRRDANDELLGQLASYLEVLVGPQQLP
ncbi:MAG: hypothetical protein JST40_14380 [Armatimonadetes bacterium]|nr:hypothetical protein [Armatimonadota bacterium]